MRTLALDLDIARPPAEVQAWWLDLPAVYEAEAPEEQPHRIVKVAEEEGRIDLLTYWRGPMGRELELPETIFLDQESGWRIEIGLPFGLAQEDIFTLTPTEEGTRLTIEVELWAERWYGRLALPLFWAYARRAYPKTWETAARLCEQAGQAAP